MTQHPIRLAIHGALGRMGDRLCALAREDTRFMLAASIDADSDRDALLTLAREAMTRLQLIIDFSSDSGTNSAISLATPHGAALLVGTTGLSEQTRSNLRAAAEKVPVLVASNTSLGVAVLRRLASEAARLLPGYDVDVVETHHTKKKDSPSGTALSIVDSIRSAGVEVDAGHVHAIRAGDVIGEHTVQFAAAGEIIQLTHRATTRDLFVIGALRAGAWLSRQKPGWYSIDDSMSGDQTA